MEEETPFINDVATRSFRDVADQDYITARICYRQGLMIQFVWMAEQAIEKYLKAILLFNMRSTKGHSHALMAILDEVKKIEGMRLDLSDDVIRFISYLDDQGSNRYLDKPHYTKGKELYFLDKSVWEIRRYCKYINQEIPNRSGGHKNLMDIHINTIHSLKETKRPHKFRLTGGYLEKVLEKKKHLQKDSLIWQNLYYGNKYKSQVRIPRQMNAINPTHILHPEHIKHYEKLFQIPPKIKTQINNYNQRSKRKKT